jgi:hypothetical protein
MFYSYSGKRPNKMLTQSGPKIVLSDNEKCPKEIVIFWRIILHFFIQTMKSVRRNFSYYDYLDKYVLYPNSP